MHLCISHSQPNVSHLVTTLVSNYTQFLFCSNEKALSRSSHRNCSGKKDALKNFEKINWKTSVSEACDFIKNKTLAHVFSSEFFDISKNTSGGCFLSYNKEEKFIIPCFNILGFMPCHRKFLKSFQKKKCCIYFSTFKGSCVVLKKAMFKTS